MKNYWLTKKAERLGFPQICEWDFQTALADTIREKYEPLYVKVVEIANVVNRKPLPVPLANDRIVEMANMGLEDDLPVYPPWNTNADLQDVDLMEDAMIVYPLIYGFKTPQKDKFIFVDKSNNQTEGWDN